jgi:DNA modification methylase
MSEVELAYTNFLTSTKHISHMWHGFKRDSEAGQKVLHPTQKPIVVMQWCLNLLPKEVVTICDPYIGSGSTLVACAKMGRKGIGIELDPDYFEIACKRVEEAYKQPDMFTEQPKEKPVQEGLEI